MKFGYFRRNFWQLKLGDQAVVLGAGPIGLFCLQVAKAAGASSVIVSEPAPARAETARALGAEGRRGAFEHFGLPRMCREFVDILEHTTDQ